jgi:acyl carrier protein
MKNELVFNTIKKVAKDRNVKIVITEKQLDVTLKELKIDSLEIMGIIVDTENQLNVRIPDDELGTIRTFNDLINALDKQLTK